MQLKRQVLKKSFTLLEILICLVLIGFVGTLVGKGGYDLFTHYQFKMGVQNFLSDIRRFQMLAMTHNCDVTCRLQKEKGGYRVLWRPDAFIPAIQGELCYFLKGVETIDWQGSSSFIELTVFSSGRISQDAPITFFSIKTAKPITIDVGYPVAFSPLGDTKLAPRMEPSYPEIKQMAN